MIEKETLDSLRYLNARLDTLEARSDVLAIALKHVIRTSSDPDRAMRAVRQALESTEERALFSPQASEPYLAAFGAMRERVCRWLEGPLARPGAG